MTASEEHSATQPMQDNRSRLLDQVLGYAAVLDSTPGDRMISKAAVAERLRDIVHEADQ